MSRGARRLEIAKGLLKLAAWVDVLKYIKALPEAKQNRLRGLVDWVEDYERHEEDAQHEQNKT